MVTAAIGGALALGSAIYGSLASANQNRKARQLIQQQRDDNRQWYERRMNEDYTSRTDAQAVVNKQRELLDEQMKRARGLNVVAGGTDASVAMQKAAANDAVAQTMSGIASEAADYKNDVERQYRAEDAALNQQQAATHAAQAKDTAAAASQAVNAGINLAGMGAGMGTGAVSPAMSSVPDPATVAGSGANVFNAAKQQYQQQVAGNPLPKAPKLNI